MTCRIVFFKGVGNWSKVSFPAEAPLKSSIRRASGVQAAIWIFPFSFPLRMRTPQGEQTARTLAGLKVSWIGTVLVSLFIPNKTNLKAHNERYSPTSPGINQI